jgi:hypothetical protein
MLKLQCYAAYAIHITIGRQDVARRKKPFVNAKNAVLRCMPTMLPLAGKTWQEESLSCSTSGREVAIQLLRRLKSAIIICKF